MRVRCPACGTEGEADLTLRGVGEPTTFLDESFAYAEYAATPAAQAARCGECRVRFLFFDAIEIDALEASGLLHPRIAADRRAGAAKAKRAPAGWGRDVPAALVASVPAWVAKEWQAIPFRDDGDEVALAMSPYTTGKYEERRIAGFVGRATKGYAAAEGDLVDALVKYYGFKREEL